MDRTLAPARLALGLWFVTIAGATAQDPAREPTEIWAGTTDARAAYDVARRHAERDNRRVLVVFGGDWSVWCQRFHELTQHDRELRRLLHDEYLTVLAAIEPDEISEGNAALARSLEVDPLQEGVPFLAVAAADGTVVARQALNAFEEGENYAASPVTQFLRRYSAPPLDAHEVLRAARAQAAHDGRRLLIHLGAPWCGWCGRLEDFLALPEIEPLIAKDLIDVKIDQDRMTNGKEVAQNLRGARGGGIPWITITDADLNEIVNSDGPEGNVGYPVTPGEIAHFMVMLEKVRENLTEEDLAEIRAILDARAKEILDARERARRAREERKKRQPKPDDGSEK